MNSLYTRIGFLLLLGGCVTNTPDTLFSETQKEPLGEVQKTGRFPNIGQDAVGQTEQLTPTQRAEMEAELAREAQAASQKAAPNAEAEYLREVEALKRLARQREQALRQQIEGEDATQ